MDNNQASRTAQLAAIYRAYHSKHDNPKIFDDFLAAAILKEGEISAFEKQMVYVMKSYNPQLAATFPDEAAIVAYMMQSMAATPQILSRARYAEDYLEKAVKRGVKQYVILGAGLDTFVFRHRDLLNRLEVFEVDHPATQQFKKDRLSELKWEIPEQLHFISVDFNQENLAQKLMQSSYDPQVLTLFSWLGVTYYLPREVVLATLQSIANITLKGSQIIFDYLNTDAFIPEKAVPRVQTLLQLANQEKEPMQAGFDPDNLKEDLTKLGLSIEEDLNPDEIQIRYFQNRKDRYYACEHEHFACAIVE